MNNTIVSVEMSPNKKQKAVIFERDLGATTRKTYNLSILKSNKELKDYSGNVYISYDKFEIEWIDDKNLQVTLINDVDEFKKNSKFCGVNIKYLVR